MDVHTAKDSQNGFDNGGRAWGFEWIDGTHFKHWSILDQEWAAKRDPITKEKHLDFDNI
jgi:glucan 1,3-beta-glucosidase